jgi:hypothetical protein
MGSKGSKAKKGAKATTSTPVPTKNGAPQTLAEQYGNGVGPIEEYVLPLPASYYQTAAPVYQPQTAYIAPAPQWSQPVTAYVTEVPHRHHRY